MHWELIIFCQIILGGIIITFYRYFIQPLVNENELQNNGKVAQNSGKEEPNYHRRQKGLISSGYTTFHTLLLILTSIIPIYFCYKYASANEQLLWTKHAHVQVAKSIFANEDLVKNNYRKTSLDIGEHESHSRFLQRFNQNSKYHQVGGILVEDSMTGDQKSLSIRKYGKVLPSHINSDLEALWLTGTPSNYRLLSETKAFIT